MKIPKPKYCGQNWLDMTPTENGKLCEECKKNIIDFSQKSWAEIEKTQIDNNNSICGMYSKKQLQYWGQEVPTFAANKSITTAAIVVGLTTGSVFGQVANKADTLNTKTIIAGTITGISKNGNIDTLGYTTVYLKGTKTGVFADELGRYSLDISDHIDTIQNPTIVYSTIGYISLEYTLGKELAHNIHFDPQLSQDIVGTTYFYVEKPTIWKRIAWTFKKWFGREK
ncbi:MAG: hypothetical protein R2798_13740 [Chitinophagales bacterium]|nr:hypothetical protein [Bacteroidota bacterium]MCB9044187.1 hypothetical protein [Chitinophagales bacterium]